jgi:cytochrome c peroxidase
MNPLRIGSTANVCCVLAMALVSFTAYAQNFNGGMTGTWWDPARGGEGQFISFEEVGNRTVAVLAYFTYDADGNPNWHVGSVDYSSSDTSLHFDMVQGNGPSFGVGFRADEVVLEPAGKVTLDYIACDRLLFTHEDEEILQFEIVRLVGPLNGVDCHGGAGDATTSRFVGSASGSWWDAARSGEGQFIAFERAGDRRVASVFYFSYDREGQSNWLVGNVDYEADADRIEVPLVTGSGARFGSAFSSDDVQIKPAGRALLESRDCSGMRLRYTGHVTFGLNLSRLVGELVDVSCTLAVSPPTAQDNTLRALIEREGLTGDPSAGRELPGIDAPLAQLGKLLFFSKSLGGDKEVACASCHHPALGGGDGLALPIGAAAVNPDVVGRGRRMGDDGILVGRNSNTIFNTALYDAGLFWDSRVESLGKEAGENGAGSGIRTPDSAFGSADPMAGPNLLAAQARFPVVNPEEMLGTAFPNMNDEQVRNHLAARLGNYGSGAGQLPPSDWLARFQDAFESDGSAEDLITFANIALAIGEYQRSAIFVESPWARYVRGDNDAISGTAKAGAMIFFRRVDEGGGQCIQCHSGDFFTDEKHHVIGFPQVGPGPGDPGQRDFGRERQSGDGGERFAFRTPSLLNVELTAPYGHAGAYASLETAFSHYVVPGDTVRDFLQAQGWCLLPPFLNNDTCRATLSTVQANSMEALGRMEDIRIADSVNGMPLINLAFVQQTSISRMVAFLQTLTDPCLRDRECFGRWIPDPEEAPDGLQLNAVDHQGRPL